MISLVNSYTSFNSRWDKKLTLLLVTLVFAWLNLFFIDNGEALELCIYSIFIIPITIAFEIYINNYVFALLESSIDMIFIIDKFITYKFV